MSLGAIWAQASNRVIGRDGGIPWHLPEDMAHFREVTSGATVIMGRRTWDSLPPRFRPLPGRRNIVLTRDPEWTADGAERASGLEDALARADKPNEPLAANIWVLGGASVYGEAMSLADRLEVTEIDAVVDGDVHAPVIGDGWVETGETPEWSTSANGLRYRFRSYARSTSTTLYRSTSTTTGA